MLIGAPIEDLDTPALLIDLDILESNIERMAHTFREAGVNWRPHTKALKIPALAHKLQRAGANGITCSKLSEAETMVAAGIHDILITTPVVGRQKLVRLACLARQADPIVVVDCMEHVETLDEIASAYDVKLRVLVEVDNGAHRCGVQPGLQTIALAKEVHRCAYLRLAGVMAWESHTLGVKPMEEKRARVEHAVRLLVETAQQCRTAGLPIEIVSCGGTGTYWITSFVPGVTEIQAGGGIYGDVFYRTLGVDHPYAMTVIATVVSRPTATRIVTDAGFKAMGTAQALPEAKGMGRVRSVKISAEHGVIEMKVPTTTISVGDKLEWYVGYTDSTTFLHDTLFGTRGGIVEVAWPIWGRGKLQ